jgi:hypothetical protein
MAECSARHGDGVEAVEFVAVLLPLFPVAEIRQAHRPLQDCAHGADPSMSEAIAASPA